jgi:hypothetical protein
MHPTENSLPKTGVFDYLAAAINPSTSRLPMKNNVFTGDYHDMEIGMALRLMTAFLVFPLVVLLAFIFAFELNAPRVMLQNILFVLYFQLTGSVFIGILFQFVSAIRIQFFIGVSGLLMVFMIFILNYFGLAFVDTPQASKAFLAGFTAFFCIRGVARFSNRELIQDDMSYYISIFNGGRSLIIKWVYFILVVAFTFLIFRYVFLFTVNIHDSNYIVLITVLLAFIVARGLLIIRAKNENARLGLLFKTITALLTLVVAVLLYFLTGLKYNNQRITDGIAWGAITGLIFSTGWLLFTFEAKLVSQKYYLYIAGFLTLGAMYLVIYSMRNTLPAEKGYLFPSGVVLAVCLALVILLTKNIYNVISQKLFVRKAAPDNKLNQ